jgi:geranylgeranyl diphosphate synthase type I
MVDDILGIWGDSAVTGKPVGDDLLTRKMTYPVIAALDAGDDHAAALAALYARPPGPDDDLAAMTRHIEATDARRLTQERAEVEERAALEALQGAGIAGEALEWCREYARSAVVRVA